jgi:hypothetical protein
MCTKHCHCNQLGLLWERLQQLGHLKSQVPTSVQHTSPSQMVSQRTKVRSPERAKSARSRQLSPLQN